MKVQAIDHASRDTGVSKALYAAMGPSGRQVDSTAGGTPVLAETAKLSTPRTRDVPVLEEGAPSGDTPPDPAESPDFGQGRGVLRLLESGHFKGVADIRLRINFFEELSLRANGEAKEQAAQQVSNLAEKISTAAEELLAPLALDDAARNSLANMIEEMSNTFVATSDEVTAAANFDLRSLTTSLQSAFDAFVQKAQLLLAASSVVPGAGIEEPVAADEVEPSDSEVPGTNEPPAPSSESLPDNSEAEFVTALEQALADLAAAFDEALANLTLGLSSAASLADPAPSTGHGAAYDKFLALYNSLRAETAANGVIA